MGQNWRGSRRRIHQKHVIDPGSELTEGSGAWGVYSGEDWGATSSGKVTTYLQGSNTLVLYRCPLPLIFGIWFDVFLIGTARRPIQLQSATRRRRPDWIVAIASVGTESVGIAWCTRIRHAKLQDYPSKYL